MNDTQSSRLGVADEVTILNFKGTPFLWSERRVSLRAKEWIALGVRGLSNDRNASSGCAGADERGRGNGENAPATQSKAACFFCARRMAPPPMLQVLTIESASLTKGVAMPTASVLLHNAICSAKKGDLVSLSGLRDLVRRVADGAPDRDLIRIAEFLDETQHARAESDTNCSAGRAAP
jgi:hypothetical protein